MFETDEEMNEYGWSGKADVWQNPGIFVGKTWPVSVKLNMSM